MEEYPLIKLEIESMKHTIIHHFTHYQQDLSRIVRQEIEEVINHFDFRSEVQKAVHEVIRNVIESYFKYGEGNGIIINAVTEALNIIFHPIKDEK